MKKYIFILLAILASNNIYCSENPNEIDINLVDAIEKNNFLGVKAILDRNPEISVTLKNKYQKRAEEALMLREVALKTGMMHSSDVNRVIIGALLTTIGGATYINCATDPNAAIRTTLLSFVCGFSTLMTGIMLAALGLEGSANKSVYQDALLIKQLVDNYKTID